MGLQAPPISTRLRKTGSTSTPPTDPSVNAHQERLAGNRHPCAFCGNAVAPSARLPAGLTRREVDVLTPLARGRSNSEIASELFVSRKTVSTHLEHIYAKLGVTTRTEAAIYAVEQGLTDFS